MNETLQIKHGENKDGVIINIVSKKNKIVIYYNKLLDTFEIVPGIEDKKTLYFNNK